VNAFLIFPHQLFKDIEHLKNVGEVYLIEEHLFFRQFAFHKQKLALHRSSMQYYHQYLTQNQIHCTYIDCLQPESDVRKLLTSPLTQKITEIHCYDPADTWLEQRLTNECQNRGMELHFHESPGFMNGRNTPLPTRKDGSMVQTDFYVAQRKQRNLLMDNNKPVGGQWTYDTDNRKRYPTGKKPPALVFPEENQFTEEARQFVFKHFPNHPGELNKGINYPSTHEEAERWLQQFLIQRFQDFGPYEDAIVQSEHWLHHSVLTPMLNIGLLTPQQIIDAAILFSDKHPVPLASLEGFIRQIVGWREFVRLFYLQLGTRQRTTNFWGFSRKIPPSFYNGTTGIAPIDECIQKLLKTGYNHHIERLMVLGNFMLLCEFDPDEVYRWFMEMYIDAYDWVMVPNVYGMSQFADGGRMCSKPYISGSNYLLKMSDYKGDGRWEKIWDGLFWSFMHRHRDFFGQNPRIGMLLKTLDRMDPDKRNQHFSESEIYLQRLDL
jgi:deoxyribodipyrimidine photolyase-related protein